MCWGCPFTNVYHGQYSQDLSTGSSRQQLAPTPSGTLDAVFVDQVLKGQKSGSELAVISSPVVSLQSAISACTVTLKGAISTRGWASDNTEFQQAHGQRIYVRVLDSAGGLLQF